jgi:hypothetical protein
LRNAVGSEVIEVQKYVVGGQMFLSLQLSITPQPRKLFSTSYHIKKQTLQHKPYTKETAVITTASDIRAQGLLYLTATSRLEAKRSLNSLGTADFYRITLATIDR